MRSRVRCFLDLVIHEHRAVFRTRLERRLKALIFRSGERLRGGADLQSAVHASYVICVSARLACGDA